MPACEISASRRAATSLYRLVRWFARCWNRWAWTRAQPEINRTLTAKGHTFTPNLVSGINIAMKKNGRKGRRRIVAKIAEAGPSIDQVYQVWWLAAH